MLLEWLKNRFREADWHPTTTYRKLVRPRANGYEEVTLERRWVDLNCEGREQWRRIPYNGCYIRRSGVLDANYHDVPETRTE